MWQLDNLGGVVPLVIVPPATRGLTALYNCLSHMRSYLPVDEMKHTKREKHEKCLIILLSKISKYIPNTCTELVSTSSLKPIVNM